MTTFDAPGPVVTAAVRTALEEDLGLLGDITSIACIRSDETSRAAFVSREEGVLAGAELVDEVYRQVDDSVVVSWNTHNGDAIDPGTEIATLMGSTRAILAGERVALNFLCHASGVASLTRRFVRASRGTLRVLDTRKTVPGLRAIQRAAVRAGGGFNHRDSLSTSVLIKDNHLAAVDLAQAVDRARSCWPARLVEVECDNLDQVVAASEAGVDLVLLDNMTPDQVTKAVEIVAGSCKVEISGGISLETIGAYSETGADFVSVGAITSSVRVLDIGLDIL